MTAIEMKVRADTAGMALAAINASGTPAADTHTAACNAVTALQSKLTDMMAIEGAPAPSGTIPTETVTVDVPQGDNQ